ncbi:unnamed protein product [Cuscuta epithymum]|uniref:Zinc finger GRF-type domain-containing protein n=1 Tax=Cuscuta epithymum TaxID=186058 RepID=A0AAV0EBS0_9ASTE|nr:unnamed protein product [Cuscuta epithymum]CAH9120245.1 unnamed protein product [Cuscuta epithymum]CAH9138379.1 unnamed protein product [Cuscuta epithymum]
MSSASSSPARKGRTITLDYEPAVYCYCALKAPLCVARESGRTFYGCQKWKVGCGYFVWKDSLESRYAVHGEEVNQDMFEGKSMISKLADQLSGVQGKIECLQEVVETEAKDAKKFRKVVGVAVIAVLGFLTMVYCNQLQM